MKNSPLLGSTSIQECSTLVELLRRRAADQPDRVGYTFLTDGETQEQNLTYGELDKKARAIGASLQAMGVRGERALLLYPPGLECLEAFMGCLYAGVVAVPLDLPDPSRISRTLPRLQAIAASAQASVALASSDVRDGHLAALRKVDGVLDIGQVKWLITDRIEEGAGENLVDAEITEDTIAYLLYTSGSTATPKGVVVSHKNLLANMAGIHAMNEHTPESVMVTWLPLSHDLGLVFTALVPLYGGFRYVGMSPIHFLYKPLRWLAAISRYRGTVSGCPNFAYDLCVRKVPPAERAKLDLSSWAIALNGAEPVRHETIERFIEAFGPSGFRREAFNPSYGMTQATCSVSFVPVSAPPTYLRVQKAALERGKAIPAAPDEAGAITFVSCGRELPGQRIAIVDPETKLEKQPCEVGEIWLRGPGNAVGYWNRPEETEELFHAKLADTGEGPFLRTEDLGFLKDGELYITGRLKDLIIVRGLNHYPQDIELTVEKSSRAVRPGATAAFSVDAGDEERLVVVSEADLGGASPADVVGDIRQAVVEQHDLMPHAIVLVKPGTIFKTASGKIQRRACRAAYLNGTLEVIA
ncbi:MAG: fatty acyl-AMP ligase [Polyangiaceae bacterium]|nr:fatty acyl-AMP ligase [Polyangiaceae bacterium]